MKPSGRTTLRKVRLGLLLVLAAFVAFMAAGNLVIAGASVWVKETSRSSRESTPHIEGVGNLRRVDERVWRGAAPSMAGYERLAARGVRTVVDLRAEDDVHVDTARLRRAGVRYVRIPIRDGQTPREAEVDRFLSTVAASPGVTFVHCGAGVGRTGTMAAAYAVATHELTSHQALRRNLAVGPPSLEQLAFVASLGGGDVDRPHAVLVAASRTLDAPRRIWSVLHG